jgi:hypothetical protein
MAAKLADEKNIRKIMEGDSTGNVDLAVLDRPSRCLVGGLGYRDF